MSLIKYVDRSGTDSAKWDALSDMYSRDGLLSFWVADMDFAVDSHISEAISKYCSTEVFGYWKVPDSYYEAFIGWEKSEHGLAVEREWMRFTPGVVTGFNIALNVLTEPGDAVMVSTPVYYPFMNAVKANGCRLTESELVNDRGSYSIDFDDFEKKISENDVKAYILCSPHNPVSRVWTEDELRMVLEICRRHDVALISDEIHHDFVYGSRKHVPMLSLADKEDRVIMLTAASKSFNIAALQHSTAVIENDGLREAWDRFTTGISLRQGNPMGYIATEAAYRYGKPWLNEVKAVICGNYEYISSELAAANKGLILSPLEGTYLAWADFGAYLKPDEIKAFMEEKCGLAFDYGEWFGGKNSGTHIRINLATSRENTEELVRRVGKALKELR